MKQRDISDEKSRSYVYANNVVYTIDRPITLYLTEDTDQDGRQGHRVVDLEGVVHNPHRSWVAITWRTFDPSNPVQF